MSLGTAIKILRIREGLSQKQLASLVSIQVPYLSAIETNKKTPSISLQRALEKALNIPENTLPIYALEKPEGISEKQSKLFDHMKSLIQDIQDIMILENKSKDNNV